MLLVLSVVMVPLWPSWVEEVPLSHRWKTTLRMEQGSQRQILINVAMSLSKEMVVAC